MYRYAQDLQDLMDQHSELQKRYQSVLHAQGYASVTNDLLTASLRNSGTPYLVTDGNGHIVQLNAGAEQLLGESAVDLRGMPLLQLAPFTERTRLTDLQTKMASPESSNAVWQCQVALFDGLELDSISMFDGLVMPVYTFGRIEIYWLLCRQSSAGAEPLTSLPRFALLQDSSNGLLITDARGTIVCVNPAFTRITGYAATESIGQNAHILGSGHHDATFYQAFWHDLSSVATWSGEFFNRRKGGQIYPEWKTVKAIKSQAGATIAYLSAFADISQHISSADPLSLLAYRDALTGLPNRRALEDRFAHALVQAQLDGIGMSVFFIDLDRFKPVNDDLGHAVGDLVLQQVSQRLKQAIRQGDTAARVGGDEFVVVLQSAVRPHDIELIANNILSALNAPMQCGTHQVLIGASIGCARFPQDADNMVTLLKHADSAMYAAKHMGGNHFSFYQSDADHRVVPSIGLDLWHAIERQQLHMVYQPQVSAEGQLHGCEALLRWTHPTLGELSPLKFIPVAETNGAILALGDWVLTTACRQLRSWQANGMPALNMSVNVSSRQLRDPSFPDRVCQILQTCDVAPHFLELEITESEALQSPLVGNERLQKLRALGIRIAIDDFGTGYSSLSRLKTLPIDRLKIDQSFVRDVGSCQDARAISQCFVSMGLAMGKEVVAEGVETPEQLQVLASQGCHQIQGYLTGRPMAAASFFNWAMRKPPPATTESTES